MRQDVIQLIPHKTTLNGKMDGRPINVLPAGKPPKLRFRPGTLLEYRGQAYEVIYCCRVREQPSEWLYMLEERGDGDLSGDYIGQFAASLGCGNEVPRVVKEIFFNRMDAMMFFMDIPSNGDRAFVENGSLVRHAKVLEKAK